MTPAGSVRGTCTSHSTTLSNSSFNKGAGIEASRCSGPQHCTLLCPPSVVEETSIGKEPPEGPVDGHTDLPIRAKEPVRDPASRGKLTGCTNSMLPSADWGQVKGG